MDERVVDLEMRVAFQEHAIEQLSTALAAQQREIERLLKSVEDLRQRLAALTPSLVASEQEETPPPHY